MLFVEALSVKTRIYNKNVLATQKFPYAHILVFLDNSSQRFKPAKDAVTGLEVPGIKLLVLKLVKELGSIL